MKVLVFGANGLVGTWTVASLINSGVDVVAVSQNSNRIKYLVSKKLKVVVDNADQWSRVLLQENPDVIIHCDWAGVASNEKDSPTQFLNTSRWIDLAHYAVNAGISKVIYLGSQAEYGHNLSDITFSTPFSPLTNYGKSKVEAFRELTQIYEHSGSQFVWARLFSIYGALDEGNWLVPSLIRSLMRRDEFLLSSGTQKWNYLHVSDVARALTILAQESFIEKIVNIGAAESIPVFEIAKYVANELNSLELLKVSLDSVNPIAEVKADIRILLELGWTQMIKPELGLVKTVEWFQGENQFFSQYGFSRIDLHLPARQTLE